MIPDSIVEEVRARADIVDIIGEHVPLKRAGKEYRALCPFHSEKTPSFYVVPAKGFYTCFGCGASGDLFTFLMERLGLDFPEAVKTVAARVGVEVREVNERSPEQDRNQPYYEAVAFAEDFYRRTLHSEAGEKARRYLAGRGLGEAEVERFGLGYAPDEWRALIEAASPHAIGEDVLMEAGLIKTSEKGGEPYDRLRDRVVFPIRDVTGRTIAFGGRVLGKGGPGQPKYLNSPETPIYHKGSTLYGLSWAKTAIRREEAVLVVEGYMDYVSLAARGVENVVAPLGTAMTEEQAALLARYAKKALLLYDSDSAGLRASFRTADALLRAGVHPRIVTLPEGEDPDTLVQKEGGRPLRKALDAAVDVLERKMQILDEHGFFDDIAGTRRALDRLLPTVRSAIDPALRDLYIDRISKRTGVRAETLEEELRQEPPRREYGARQPDAGSSVAAGPGMPGSGRRGGSRAATGGREGVGTSGQRQLLLLLLRDRTRIAPAAAALSPADFTDAAYAEIFTALTALPADAGEGGAAPVEGIVLEDAAAERLKRLLEDPEEIADADRTFEDAVHRIRAPALRRRLAELDRLIQQAESKGEHERKFELVNEKNRLRRTEGHGWDTTRRKRDGERRRSPGR